jgi:hypothetical protein
MRQRSGGSRFKASPWANNLRDSISKKSITKKRLVEWLKVTLSSNPSIIKKKRERERKKAEKIMDYENQRRKEK